MKSNEGKQLKEWLASKRMSAKELADSIGVTDQAIYAQIKKDIVADSFKHKVAKANLDIFKEDFVSDKPTIYKPKISLNPQNGSLPVYDVYGRAGKAELFNTMDNIDVLGYIKVPGYENCLGWVKVKGDSMSPYLNSGDYIALKQVDIAFINWGNVYFIVFTGDLTPEPMVKYVRKSNKPDYIVLRSHNEKYEDMEIPLHSVRAIYAVRGGVIEIQ